METTTGRNSYICIIFFSDVNEAPKSLILSNISAQESTSNESFISTLSAEDPDRTNQSFTYTVRDSSSSFRISGVNRDQLIHVGVINFESTPSIRVRLRVTDNGGLFLEKEFTITVLGLFKILVKYTDVIVFMLYISSNSSLRLSRDHLLIRDGLFIRHERPSE